MGFELSEGQAAHAVLGVRGAGGKESEVQVGREAREAGRGVGST